MPRKPKQPKPIERVNSENAMRLANTGMNPAYTQTNLNKVKNAEGKWVNGDAYTSSKQGRLSTNGRTAGGSTWTFTPKNDDGSPVLGRNGKPRQSGRSQIASRRQREYDIKVGLNNGWQDENGLWHGGPAPEGAQVAAALTTG